MSKEIEILEQFVDANFQWWSENLELGLGVRFLEISGELFRDTVAKGEIEQFWKQVKKQLPEDVVLMKMGTAASPISCFLQSISSGQYTDGYLTLLGSKEWEAKPEGEAIEILDIKINFDRLPNTSN